MAVALGVCRIVCQRQFHLAFLGLGFNGSCQHEACAELFEFGGVCLINSGKNVFQINRNPAVDVHDDLVQFETIML